MPQPLPAGLRLGIVEPVEAAAAFARRGLLEPSFRWQDVWQDEHSRAFAVAGVMRLDVLQVFRDELELAVRNGTRLEDFSKAIRPALAAKGFWGNVRVTEPETGETRTTRFDARRLQLIFEVNTRQSYAAGRWERIERVKKRFPLIMYRTMRDERVRASHKPWDGVVLPVDHEFWNTHFPPCGWRCRCTAFGIDQKGVDRLRAAGLPVKTEPPPVQWITYVNPRTGETAAVPRGIDPGFAYNPGKRRDAEFFEAALRKATQSSPVGAAVAVAQATLDHPAVLAQTTAVFTDWVATVLQAGRAQGQVQYVGALNPGAVRALQAIEREPMNSVIAVRDRDVLHALRDAKSAAGIALPVGVYARMPELLRRASALLLELQGDPALLYVIDLVREDGAVAKLVLQLDVSVKLPAQGKRVAVPLNVVRTATVIDPNALRDRTRYQLVWGTLE